MTATDWIQAVCAIATSFLAFVTFHQGRKIKTLTDIVTSLEKQASIAQEMLSFEIRCRMKDMQPFFEIRSSMAVHEHYEITFKNSGLIAKGVDSKAGSNIKTIGTKSTTKTIGKEELYTLTIIPNDIGKEYSFYLVYNDGIASDFRQEIKGIKHSTRISLPIIEG